MMISEQHLANFQQRAVRDLAWALFHPPLFQSLSEIPTDWLQPTWQDDEVLPWLLALDKEPTPLLTHLKDQRATRLGVYFEQLLSFYFSQYPRFSLIAKNLQANDSQRTIGEYDFIVWDKQHQQHYHIEVAVKFYIGLQTLDCDIAKNTPLHNWHLWVGPNKKDTLAIKMNHLIHHQLRLSDTPAGKAALESIGLTPDQVTPKLLLTGRLYYPEHQCSSLSRVTPPQHSHITPHTHHWVSLSRLQTLINPSCSYVLLPRQLWMAPLASQDIINHSLDIITAERLESQVNIHMHRSDTPLHIAAIDPVLQQENLRFFVIA
jgi:hypothetical protein